MLNINVDFTESFYNKTNPQNIENSIKETIEYATEQIVEGCKTEAPVRTGNLREGHYSRIDNLSGYVCNDVEYAQYVIYGTSRQSANNYPQRVMNKIQPNMYQSRFHSSLITRGVI